MLNVLATTTRRQAVGICAGLAAALIAAPAAAAAPDCSPGALSNTVSSTTGAAHQYLAAHPDADAAVTAAFDQPGPAAAANLRSYFTAHPQQYYELRGILAPIGEAQQQCNTTLLPPHLAPAYDQFMAG